MAILDLHTVKAIPSGHPDPNAGRALVAEASLLDRLDRDHDNPSAPQTACFSCEKRLMHGRLNNNRC